MPYDWSKTLSPDESIEKEFAISPFFLKVILIVSVLLAIPTALTAPLAGAGIFVLGIFYWFYLRRAKHYVLTKKRVVLVDAFLGINVTSIDYQQITDVAVEQSLIDELGHWGTLVINTAGTHTPPIRLSFVPDPQRLKQTLDTVRDTNPATVQIAHT